MSFEYGLLPKPEAKVYSDSQLESMGEYIGGLPNYKWGEKTYTIFLDEEDKQATLPLLIALNGQSYIHPYIILGKEEVILSIVGNPVGADHHLYNFVCWCHTQFPCDLFYWDKIVSPEEMLAEPE